MSVIIPVCTKCTWNVSRYSGKFYGIPGGYLNQKSLDFHKYCNKIIFSKKVYQIKSETKFETDKNMNNNS